MTQLHVNTWASLETNPMRSTSEILHDPTGRLRTVVNEAKRLEPVSEGLATDCIRFFWIRVVMAMRSLERGELLRAHAYFADIRTAVLRLIRVETGRFRPGIAMYPPAANFERDYGSQLLDEIRFLMPGSTLYDTWRALGEAVEWMESYSAPLGDRDLGTEERRIIAAITAEVRRGRLL